MQHARDVSVGPLDRLALFQQPHQHSMATDIRRQGQRSEIVLVHTIPYHCRRRFRHRGWILFDPVSFELFIDVRKIADHQDV